MISYDKLSLICIEEERNLKLESRLSYLDGQDCPNPPSTDALPDFCLLPELSADPPKLKNVAFSLTKQHEAGKLKGKTRHLCDCPDTYLIATSTGPLNQSVFLSEFGTPKTLPTTSRTEPPAGKIQPVLITSQT